MIHHGVNDLAGAHEFALQRFIVYIKNHSLGQIALGYRADDAGHLGCGLTEVRNKGIHRISLARPGPAHWPKYHALR